MPLLHTSSYVYAKGGAGETLSKNKWKWGSLEDKLKRCLNIIQRLYAFKIGLKRGQNFLNLRMLR